MDDEKIEDVIMKIGYLLTDVSEKLVEIEKVYDIHPSMSVKNRTPKRKNRELTNNVKNRITPKKNNSILLGEVGTKGTTKDELGDAEIANEGELEGPQNSEQRDELGAQKKFRSKQNAESGDAEIANEDKGDTIAELIEIKKGGRKTRKHRKPTNKKSLSRLRKTRRPFRIQSLPPPLPPRIRRNRKTRRKNCHKKQKSRKQLPPLAQ